MRPHRRRGGSGLGLLAALALLIALAACTGDGSAPDGDASPTGPTDRSSSTTSTTTPAGPGWYAVHADRANTDYSSHRGADDVRRAWTTQIEGDLMIGPLPWTINLGATTDRTGRAYVTSTEDGCHLRAVDVRTGATAWCDERLDLFAVVSSPLLDRDGHLYVADGSGMHALDRTGRPLWSTPLDGVPLSTQFTPDGRLVFVTNVGTVYVLDRDDGRPAMDPVVLAPGVTWSSSQGMMACARGTEACPSANTLAVSATGDLFFTLWKPGAKAAGVAAMRYRGGPRPRVEPLWTNDTLPGGSASSPVLSHDDRRVYVTDNVDRLHALDARTGAAIWDVEIGYASGGSPSLSPDGLVMPAGGADSPTLAIRDAGDHGELAWRDDDLHNRGIATQMAGDRAYVTDDVGDYRCDLVVVDTTDGTELDREHLPGVCVFTVGTTVAPDGTILVPTITGALHAFRPAAAG